MVAQKAEWMRQARVAIRTGQLPEARRVLRQLIHHDPENYVAWLLMARATPSSQAALEYVRRAQMLEPRSPLVQRARQNLERRVHAQAHARARQGPRWRFVAAIAAFFLVLLAVWQARGFADKALTAVANAVDLIPIPAALAAPATDGGPSLVVAMHKPVPRPAAPATATGSARDTAAEETAPAPEEVPPAESTPGSSVVENSAVVVEAAQEIEAGAEEASPAQDAGQEPGLATAVPEPQANSAAVDTALRPGERWIDVNLTTQSLVAYEGDVPVYHALISSGTWDHPTITGKFRTWIKYEKQDMNGYLLGYDYYLPGVPFVMYFYGDYAIHGAYWHNNFGTPMSHGCVNVHPNDAGWLFNWAPVGTLVDIHY